MLRQIASLFLAGADRLDTQIGFFDDVLLRLMESVETSTPYLSTLPAVTSIPREAVRRLAYDAMAAARSWSIGVLPGRPDRDRRQSRSNIARDFGASQSQRSPDRRHPSEMTRPPAVAKNEGAHFPIAGTGAGRTGRT